MKQSSSDFQPGAILPPGSVWRLLVFTIGAGGGGWEGAPGTPGVEAKNTAQQPAVQRDKPPQQRNTRPQTSTVLKARPPAPGALIQKLKAGVAVGRAGLGLSTT